MVPRLPGAARPDPPAGSHAGPRGAVPGTQDDHLRWGACLAGLSRIEQELSHEFRSRVHGLVLHAGLLAQLGRGADPGGEDVRPRLARYAEVMNDELSRLRETTDALLRLLRLEDDPAGPASDLGALLRELAPLLAPYARMRRVGWVPSIPGTPVSVGGDAPALRQALFLLLLEAIDRVPPGDALELSLVATQGGAALTVTDPGGALAARLARAMDAVADRSRPADLGARAVAAVLQATSARVAPAAAGIEVRWPAGAAAG